MSEFSIGNPPVKRKTLKNNSAAVMTPDDTEFQVGAPVLLYDGNLCMFQPEESTPYELEDDTFMVCALDSESGDMIVDSITS